jgi:hypothetical protein
VIKNESFVPSRLGVSAWIDEVVVVDFALEDVATDHDNTC